MIAVLFILAVITVANLALWGSLLLRFLGVRLPVRIPAAPFVEPHKGRHVASQPRATLPRRKPMVNRQPWQTQAFPVPTPEQMRADYFLGQRLWGKPGDWGTRPVADVLEGERLAGVTLP